LNNSGFQVDTLRGPVKESVLLPVIGGYDGVICGDDEYTRDVIAAGKAGKLKVLSKYGIGLDKIDVAAAKELGVTVTNCPGVNHTTVAEHVFALLLSFVKNIPEEVAHTRNGSWTRITGNEIFGKTLGIFGLGKIGKEVAIRARAFGMQVMAYDRYFDESFATVHGIRRGEIDEILAAADIVSLNMDLNPESRHLISMERVQTKMKKGMIIINTARGELADLNAILHGLDNYIIKGYLTDVLEEEPMDPEHPLKNYKNVLITPHIGSRTYESVERQGTMAVENLLKNL